jgi:hypothetical protein
MPSTAPPRLDSGDVSESTAAAAAVNRAKTLTTVMYATHANAQLCATIKAGVLVGQDIHLFGEVHPIAHPVQQLFLFY